MPRLGGLQMLRAVAAVLVLVGHVIAEAEHYLSADLPGDAVPWTRGVDIFFVISGFIIALSMHKHRGAGADFLYRRFVRVVPLYTLFTTLMVAALMMPGAVKSTQPDLGQVVSSYLFVPHARADGRIAPVLSPGWTLNYEIAFYILAAAALACRRPLVVLGAALCILAAAGTLPLGGTAFEFYTNPLMLEFLFGLGLARLYLGGWRIRSSPALAGIWLLGGSLLVGLDGSGLPRVLAAGIPAGFLVAGAALWHRQIRWPFQALGDASYALYLSHRFVLRTLTLLVLPVLAPGPATALFFVAMACTLAVLVALLVYQFVELPVLRAMYPAGSRKAAA